MNQTVKNLPARQETRIQSLDQEGPLEKGMAIHSSILAWRIRWTGEPGGLQSLGSQRAGHDRMTHTHNTRVCRNAAAVLENKTQTLHSGLKLWWGKLCITKEFQSSDACDKGLARTPRKKTGELMEHLWKGMTLELSFEGWVEVSHRMSHCLLTWFHWHSRLLNRPRNSSAWLIQGASWDVGHVIWPFQGRDHYKSSKLTHTF